MISSQILYIKKPNIRSGEGTVKEIHKRQIEYRYRNVVTRSTQSIRYMVHSWIGSDIWNRWIL